MRLEARKIASPYTVYAVYIVALLVNVVNGQASSLQIRNGIEANFHRLFYWVGSSHE